jgi:DNA-binding SARP family transcriptional activator
MLLMDHCPRRLQELFCFLELYRDRAHPRETPAGLLWGDGSTTQSRKNLRQALWQLQNVTGTEADPAGECRLLVDPDQVCLNPAADLRLDVEVFEQAFVHARGISGTELDAEQAQALCCAGELCRGDLLEGWYHERKRRPGVTI